MFNKFELVGAGVSVVAMAAAIYLTQVEANLLSLGRVGQPAQLQSSQESGVVIVDESSNSEAARSGAIREATDNGKLNRMVIDDIKIGTGEEVKEGDAVAVHYIGRLQDGTEFDNSHKRGSPIEFEVGSGTVIEGWEQGVQGMKVGGQRVLVIPPEMAYGSSGTGPIPGDATLVFAVELMEIK